MRIAQEKVALFHEMTNQPIALRPSMVDDAVGEYRLRLLTEELKEYKLALLDKDVVQVADALGDLLYVVLGCAVAHGIELEPIFDEIHRSNMTKTPLDPATGKPGKGPDYKAPRIADLLLVQTFGGTNG